MPINTYLSHVIHNNKAESILGATPVQPGELGEAPTGPTRNAITARRTGGDSPKQGHEARDRFSYDGVLPGYHNPYQAPLSTPAAAAPTREHRSQRRETLVTQLDSRGRTGRRSGDGDAAPTASYKQLYAAMYK
jgi:hypothetical protein